MNRRARVRQNKDRGNVLEPHLADPPHSPHQPTSSNNLRQHTPPTLISQRKSVDRNSQTLEPSSSSSPSSSRDVKIAAYNPPSAPGDSFELNGRHGEAGYCLKTSTDLLKVLNRIWSLEEQHVFNVSLAKKLRTELEKAQAQIKDLIQERQADRQEIDELMKQVAESKHIRKRDEQERIKEVVHSMRDELEDERKLRRHSESLHRKLVKELSELKLSFSETLKDLERERKARILLEDLCDEFAKGVTGYEQEVRKLKKSNRDHSLPKKKIKDHSEKNERLILHISEAWLDGRMQCRASEVWLEPGRKEMIVDKLRCDIETFLEASKKSNQSKIYAPRMKDSFSSDVHPCRYSLESACLYDDTPQDAGDEDSMVNDVCSFGLSSFNESPGSNFCCNPSDKKQLVFEELKRNRSVKKKEERHEKTEGHNPSSLQLELEKKMNRSRTQLLNFKTGSGDISVVKAASKKPSEIQSSVSEKSGGSQDRKGRWDAHSIDGMTRNPSVFSKASKNFTEYERRGSSHGRLSRRSVEAASFGLGMPSPVQQWNVKNAFSDLEITESFSKWQKGLKQSTMKSKLLEARLEGQHARLKSGKSGMVDIITD